MKDLIRNFTIKPYKNLFVKRVKAAQIGKDKIKNQIKIEKK